MPDNRTRGILFLALGAVFPLVLLIGGGVISSTHGDYWTRVFVCAYLIGLGFPGVWVYQSAKRTRVSSPVLSSRPSMPQRLMSAAFLGVAMVFWALFFKSEFFATPAAQHGFFIFTGLALAQFIPLGLGSLWSQPDSPLFAKDLDSAPRP